MSQELMALAIIPGLLIVLYVYTKDKVEKEPLGLILKIIAFGAIVCIIAGYVEAFAETFFPRYPEGSLGYALVNAFGLAAFWEELLKYLALKIGSWKSKSFNYRFDGIVYGVSSAVGFAVFENIMYVSEYGLQTAIVRAFTAVPLHAFCGVFMGVFYALAKKNSILGMKGKSTFFKLMALIVPMIIHGIYDTFAFLGTSTSEYMLLIFVVILYITAIKTIKKMSAADRHAGFYPEARVINYTVE